MNGIRFSIAKFKRLYSRNVIFNSCLVIILLLGIIAVPRIFAEPQVVKSVEIFSERLNYMDKEPGSWKVTKSAKWKEKGIAEITFDVDTVMKSNTKYTDILFVLDVSGSMSGEKLDRVKADTIELINRLLSNDKNKAGLITFETDSQIVSPFTNKKEELIENVSNLTTGNMTNYYEALVNAGIILENYVKENDRDCIILFLTDGYPNEETPNEVGQYSYLKSQYPFITINGVQYEMGSRILEPIKNVTDNQYVADMETLNNVLFDASIHPVIYRDFSITDYIDANYFYVKSKNDISVSQGSVIFDKDNQKFTWKMDNLKSGLKAKMTIIANLKDELIGEGGFFPTNKKEDIKSKIYDNEEDVKSTVTPILANKYKVSYDLNEPNGCVVDGKVEEKYYSIFDMVEVSDKEPKCSGYQFNDWKIVTENVEKINDEYFIMPEEDVKIIATWSKLDLKKSMNGSVSERTTLYKQVKSDYENNNYAKKYTGPTDTFAGKEDVYYYYGDTPNNNVLFGGFCWRMYRTTDTGGVKMVYNGEPDSDGRCGTERNKHVGYGNRIRQTLSSNYIYGTDYTYDDVLKVFTLSGTLQQLSLSNSNYSEIVGKYTCINTTESCSTLYYVESYISSNSAYVLPIQFATTYSQIGESIFNNDYRSPSDVGYMHNKRYDFSYRSNFTSKETVLNSTMLSSNFYYANDVKWGEPVGNKFNLIEPYKIDSTTDYSSLVGKYTFRNSSETYTSNSVYYITNVVGSTMYYIELGNARTLDSVDTKYYFADSLVDDGSGKQVLDSTTKREIKKSEWYDVYSDYKNKYFCLSPECTTIYYVTSTSNISMTYVNVANDYMYGNTFTYDESTKEYTLAGETKHFYDWPNNYNKLNNTHYTCWNTSGKCSRLTYFYYTTSTNAFFIQLENGASIETALYEMLHDENVNKINSNIKNMIDLWYSRNMTQYTDYLEDTVWCNDRSISNASSNGWNPNGGSNNTYLYYGPYGNGSNLTCSNKIDRFTVNQENGNGALTYPVGLVTRQEMILSYSGNSPLSSGGHNWTISPDGFYGQGSNNYRGDLAGNNIYNVVSGNYGVRPAISLKKDMKYMSGNGSVDNPYIIDLSDYQHKISISTNSGVKIRDKYALKGEKIELIPVLDCDDVVSFKMNGVLVNGDSFIMINEDVEITDVVLNKSRFLITVDGNSDVISFKSSAYDGESVELIARSGNRVVTSFKMNGILVYGNTFVVPKEDVVITDIVTVDGTVIESEHNPYPSSLNNKVYGEKTFEGATSLTVELDYQTESTSYDWIYLYDSTGKQYGKYGGTTRKTENITIPGDYVKIIFRTDSSGSNYYGFKATITPNYD